MPYEALQWLINQMQSQGTSLEDLESMGQGQQQQMAGVMTGPGSAPPMARPGGMQKPMVTQQSQISRPGPPTPQGASPGMGARPGMAPMPQPMQPGMARIGNGPTR